MKWKCISAMVLLTTALFVGLTASPMPASAQAVQYGPRSDHQIFFYADETALYAALKAGEIDVMFWELTPAQYDDAIADPKISIMRVPRLDFRSWSLNNNETIAVYPGVKSAMSYVNFRRAIHSLSDKDYYTSTITRGFATRLDVPVAAPSSGWYNLSVVNWIQNNLYFSVAKAAEWLDSGGFTQGSTPNPNYKPGVAGSAQYIRRYPADHPQKPNQDLDPVVFFARSDDLLRFGASVHLRDRMLESGIPVDFRAADFATCYTNVMSLRNYHIYSAGWSVGRFPTYLYGWFHSSRWFPGGSNYHISTTPRYPDIDAAAEKVWYPSSYEAAMEAAKYEQYLLMEKYTVIVPLWSSAAYFAYKNLVAVTNYQSVGPENEWLHMSAMRTDVPGAPIRAGLKSAPLEVNPIYSRWVWDASTMGPFFGMFMTPAPYDIMRDQGWLLQDWELSKWVDPDDGATKSKMTFWFRDGAEWIRPGLGGGDILEDFRTQYLNGGYEYQVWYYASEPAGWIYSGYMDVKKIRTYPAENKAEVYFNVYSYWSQYWPYGRMIYDKQWKQAPLATLETKTFPGPITAGSYLSLPYRTKGSPVEIVEIKQNLGAGGSITLTKASGANDNDYEMVNSKIRIYKAIPSTDSITVKYYARGDPAGYTPGGLPFEQVFANTGEYYMTELKPGLGGWASYKANRNFFMETPPLGEVDYYWFYVNPTGPKPRDGYYEVNVYDGAKMGWAFGSTGNARPSINWEPGCDVAPLPTYSKVEVTDLTTQQANLYKRFGSTSP